jgi:hypothetical protein
MRYLFVLGIATLASCQAGCSTTLGVLEPNTHFAYPNSNIQSLGHISATIREGQFLIPPTLDKEKILKLLNDALAQKPGADMIVNYRLDTTYTMYPFYYVQTVKLEGSAAKMQVGEKDLLEKTKYQ